MSGPEKKLIIVEGPIASGKSALLRSLTRSSRYAVLRGMPSQNPADNDSLVLAAQKKLQGVRTLNFLEAAVLPEAERTDIIDRVIDCVRLQFEEAKKLKATSGQHVLLDRSAMSLTALMSLAKFVAGEQQNSSLKRWAETAIQKVVRELMGNSVMTAIDGIILMEQPVTKIAIRERQGMRGLAEHEGRFIRTTVRSASEVFGIPILSINPNDISIPEEVAQARAFISGTLNR